MSAHNYLSIDQIHETLTVLRQKSGILLTGLTGGIATGKSTVANILEGLGSHIIDFDMLARKVVEPGKESWELIADYFGKNILQPDLRLDRKKLSEIVFNDPAKRKKLESFTHPYIWNEFLTQVEEISSNNPEAIIQAVIPLLIEGNKQILFKKIIVVYSSVGTQIKRLMARDNISIEKAENILNAQMPIEDKIPYGDFIVNNDGSLEETIKEVEEIWEKLKIEQKKTRTIHHKTRGTV